MGAAAAIVGRVGRRAWLTVGGGEIACFSAATDVRFLVRLVDPPRQPLPLPLYEVVVGRGPFTLTEERRLFERHAIDVLVCKASGGAATEAKMIAARELGLPVIMVRRPVRRAGAKRSRPSRRRSIGWPARARFPKPGGCREPSTYRDNRVAALAAVAGELVPARADQPRSAAIGRTSRALRARTTPPRSGRWSPMTATRTRPTRYPSPGSIMPR